MQQARVLLIFDEVERISFGISSENHWKNEKDFLHFWRTLRSIFQKNENLYTYLIVSTNPKSVETVSIDGEDNPLFSQIPFSYITPFSVKQTEEMVSKLSNIMGMEFDEIIYSKLTEDFGGHPFLIRMVCSVINKLSQENRPVKIDKIIYQRAKDKFEDEYGNYIEMVINVLKEHFEDEYVMLEFLALDDEKSFKEFASHSNDYTNHLIGYNIIEKNNNNFYFKIESIKNYIRKQKRYKKLNLTNQEKLAEISEKRNIIEPKLRDVIRTQLKAKYGENEAMSKILDLYGEPRKSKCRSLSYKDLFNPQKVNIYFEDLKKIVSKEWEVFENIFSKNKNDFVKYMESINKYRADAHAKEITDDEISYLRICIEKIDNMISDFLD